MCVCLDSRDNSFTYLDPNMTKDQTLSHEMLYFRCPNLLVLFSRMDMKLFKKYSKLY